MSTILRMNPDVEPYMTTTRSHHDPAMNPEILEPSMRASILPRNTQLLFPVLRDSDILMRRRSLATTSQSLGALDLRATQNRKFPFQHAQAYVAHTGRVQDHASGQLLNYRTSSTAIGSTIRQPKTGTATFPSSFTMGDPGVNNASTYVSNTTESYTGEHGLSSKPLTAITPLPIRGDTNVFGNNTQLISSNTSDYQLGRFHNPNARRLSLPTMKEKYSILQAWAAEDLRTTNEDFSHPSQRDYGLKTSKSTVHRALYATNWGDRPKVSSPNKISSQTQMRTDFPPLTTNRKRNPLGPDLSIKTQSGAPGLGLLSKFDTLSTTRSHYSHPGPPQPRAADPQDREINFVGSGGPVSVGTTMQTSFTGQPGLPLTRPFYGGDSVSMDEGHPTEQLSTQHEATLPWRDAVLQQINTSRHHDIKETSFKHQTAGHTNYTSTSRDTYRNYSQ